MNQKYFKAAEIFNLNFGMIGLPVPYKARSTKNKLLHVRDSLESTLHVTDYCTVFMQNFSRK